MSLKWYHPDSYWKCRHRTQKWGLQPVACRATCCPQRLDAPRVSAGWGQVYAKSSWQGEERTAQKGLYLLCFPPCTGEEQGVVCAWTIVPSRYCIWGRALYARSPLTASCSSIGSEQKEAPQLGSRAPICVNTVVSVYSDSWKAVLQFQPKCIHKHSTRVSVWVCLSNTAHLKQLLLKLLFTAWKWKLSLCCIVQEGVFCNLRAQHLFLSY